MINNNTLIVDGGEIAQLIGLKQVNTNLPSTSDTHTYTFPLYVFLNQVPDLSTRSHSECHPLNRYEPLLGRVKCSMDRD